MLIIWCLYQISFEFDKNFVLFKFKINTKYLHLNKIMAIEVICYKYLKNIEGCPRKKSAFDTENHLTKGLFLDIQKI